MVSKDPAAILALDRSLARDESLSDPLPTHASSSLLIPLHDLLAVDLATEDFWLSLRAKFAGWSQWGRTHSPCRSVSADLASFLPLDAETIARAEREAMLGSRIILTAPAGHRHIAEALGRKLAFVDEVVTSGDAADGAPKNASVESSSVTRVRREAPTLDAGIRALRLHQWAKNALVFVPLILGGKAHEAHAWFESIMAFLALGLAASATYLFNDLCDLWDDRQHWSKKLRPLASGALSIPQGLGMAVAAAAAAFALAAWAGPSVVLMLACYTALSVAYSFSLKRIPFVDTLVLAALFTMRLGMGVVATEVEFSFWLFVFSMFVFVSLSLAKRQTEIIRMLEHGWGNAKGRGYVSADAPLVLAFGVASATAAVLIMILYLIHEAFPAGFYSRPALLWCLPMLMFLWLAHMWRMCAHGKLTDDPIVFALKDHVSLCCGAFMLAIFIAAV